MGIPEEQEQLFDNIIYLQEDLKLISSLVQNDFNKLIEDEYLNFENFLAGANTFDDRIDELQDKLEEIRTRGDKIFEYYINLLWEEEIKEKE